MSKTALRIVQKMFPQVEEVVDAGRPRIIEVEDVDLKSANVKNHKSCAMAVACKRKLELDGVIISTTTAYLIKGKKATRYAVGEAVSREITSFDRGAQFAPGTYRLIPYSPSRRLGIAREAGESTKGIGQRRFHHRTAGVRAMLGGTNKDAEIA
jgi:hypothetical protein